MFNTTVQLQIVDLAGSERQSREHTEAQIKEANNINKSLGMSVC